MKTTLLRGSDSVFSEIAVPERDARAVAIERIDKHAYECRHRRAPLPLSQRPCGSAGGTPPAVRVSSSGTRCGATARRRFGSKSCRGNPGLIASVRFDGPLGLHIEQMDEGWYWCRFGGHEFSMRALGRRSAGVELVRG